MFLWEYVSLLRLVNTFLKKEKTNSGIKNIIKFCVLKIIVDAVLYV